MTNYNEKILNTIAYSEGEKKIDGSGVTVYDNGKQYRFGLGPVANALGVLPGENIEMGVARRMLDLSANDEKKNPYQL